MTGTTTPPSGVPGSAQARIQADPTVPALHITRDFRATPAQLLRAHTDPELFAAWVGPHDLTTRIDHWDARTGGSWRFTSTRGRSDGAEPEEQGFHGCFHEVSHRIVQTFTWDGTPEAVSLETLTFTDLGDGRTRLHVTSLCDSFEARDGWLAGGMAVGVDQGYESVDRLLAQGRLG